MTFRKEIGRLGMIRERKRVFVVGFMRQCFEADSAGQENAKYDVDFSCSVPSSTFWYLNHVFMLYFLSITSGHAGLAPLL